MNQEEGNDSPEYRTLVGQSIAPPPHMQQQLAPPISPWELLGGAFLVASMGGIAAVLRSGHPLTTRLVLATILNSGLVGLTIGLLLWNRYGGQDPYFIFGVSALAGLGGASTIEAMLQFARFKLLGLGPEPKPEPPKPDGN